MLAPLQPAAAQGLAVAADRVVWPRWQVRLQWLDAPALPWSLTTPEALAAPRRAALLGDYDLGDLELALPFSMASAAGRLRASSGLLLGLRPGGAAAAVGFGMPYLGLGWSAWMPGSGLSLSADLGLSTDAALPWMPGTGLRLGERLTGMPGQDLRLSPRWQLSLQLRY